MLNARTALVERSMNHTSRAITIPETEIQPDSYSVAGSKAPCEKARLMSLGIHLSDDIIHIDHCRTIEVFPRQGSLYRIDGYTLQRRNLFIPYLAVHAKSHVDCQAALPS
jgi:hypothetical protein